MGNSQDEVVVPEEEKQQEEELLKEIPADEVRQSVIKKHNLDEDIDSELIGKLTTDATELRKQLATAIKQKRGWREKATAKIEPKKEEVNPQPSSDPKPDVDDENVIDKKVREVLEERDLNALDIDDEAKKELKSYAKTAGLSIPQLIKSDFFTFKKQKYDVAKQAEKASIGGGKHGAPSGQDFDISNPPKVDMSTKEGRDIWANYRNWLKSQK